MSLVDPNCVPMGFRAAAATAGIKASGSPDVGLIVAEQPCAAAGTFTTNRFAAAPVQWDRLHLPSDSIRALLVNAGNANAATGQQGLQNVRASCERVSAALGCAPEQVLAASTGVIGRQLPMDRLAAGIDQVLSQHNPGADAFDALSRAILTTDTRPKVVASCRVIDGQTIRLLGLAKGAAMIGPRMATMLAFLITDARIAPADLQRMLSAAVDDTFNCISVEGHASTNDTVLVLASGQAAGAMPFTPEGMNTFSRLLHGACRDLARMIPLDGEGASHAIAIQVNGCRDREEARTIARSVANDVLVKTAIHGADPNWGRIVSAAGYSGVVFEPDELSLRLNGVMLFQKGAPAAYDEAQVAASLKRDRLTRIELDLNRGDGAIEFWTTDLTAEYVRLNADYTT